MKYQALYDAAKARLDKALFVHIEDNVIPFDGWFVGPLELARDDIHFDDVISTTLQMEGDTIGVVITSMGDVYAGMGVVFGHDRKDYAMGFAHGAGLTGIYDVGTGKLIKRKV